MKRPLMVIAVSLALMSAVCHARSGWFTITVSGNVNDVEFRFHKPDGTTFAPGERITLFVVQEYLGRDWNTIWLMRGDAFFRSAKYGSLPSGMTQKVEPAALSKSCTYRVAVTVTPSSGPIRYGISYFHFDKNGNALPSKPIP